MCIIIPALVSTGAFYFNYFEPGLRIAMKLLFPPLAGLLYVYNFIQHKQPANIKLINLLKTYLFKSNNLNFDLLMVNSKLIRKPLNRTSKCHHSILPAVLIFKH